MIWHGVSEVLRRMVPEVEAAREARVSGSHQGLRR
jgi:hypothetical protein